MSELKLRCKVVMLPTEKAIENITIGSLDKSFESNKLILMNRPRCGNKIFDIGERSFTQYIPNHLYFTIEYDVNSPITHIKEGDCVINSVTGTIIRVSKANNKTIDGIVLSTHGASNIGDNIALFYDTHAEPNKICCTTDPSLNIPLIPESFIEKYVEKQGKIDEVYIKLDNYLPDTDNDYGKVITRKDNTCIIIKVKDSYTREEVLLLVEKYYDIGYSNGGKVNDYISFDKQDI